MTTQNQVSADSDFIPRMKEKLSYLNTDPEAWKLVCISLDIIAADHNDEAQAEIFITENHPDTPEELYNYVRMYLLPRVVISDHPEFDDEASEYEDRILDGLDRFISDEKTHIYIWDKIVYPSVHFAFYDRMAALVEAYPTASREQILAYCVEQMRRKRPALLNAAAALEEDPAVQLPAASEELAAQYTSLLSALRPHSSHHNYEFFTPVSEDDFQLFVVNIVQVLTYQMDSYLSIALKNKRSDLISAIQTCLNEDTVSYTVEIVIGYDLDWRIFSPRESCGLDRTIQLFRTILLEESPFDYSDWVERTDEIRAEIEKQEAYQGEKPVE